LKNKFNLITSAYEISVHSHGDCNQRQLERLVLLENMILIYCENLTRHANVPRGQVDGFLILKWVAHKFTLGLEWLIFALCCYCCVGVKTLPPLHILATLFQKVHFLPVSSFTISHPSKTTEIISEKYYLCIFSSSLRVILW